MSHLSGAEHIQNRVRHWISAAKCLTSQRFTWWGKPLIAIIPSGHAFSELRIYCIIQVILLQLNVESKSI